ncbi:MAG: D-methionine transport system permease protein [Caballeronia sp.]|jgi:D-methionine transport system permease protein|nr:D-methionine transport system permease protein [Caballeronia sp.]
MPEFIAPIVADIVHRLPELLVSLSEPFLMVGIALAAAVLVGIPVGTLLYLTRKNGLIERPRLFALLDILVNVVRSFPFMILIVALIPVTRILLGTSLGTIAASVPLSIVAIVYYAGWSSNRFSTLTVVSLPQLSRWVRPCPKSSSRFC